VSDVQWCRVIEDGKTLALLRLPLDFSRIGALSEVWPDAVLTESKSLDECLADMGKPPVASRPDLSGTPGTVQYVVAAVSAVEGVQSVSVEQSIEFPNAVAVLVEYHPLIANEDEVALRVAEALYKRLPAHVQTLGDRCEPWEGTPIRFSIRRHGSPEPCIDPVGCGCTDCIVGESRPALDEDEYDWAKLAGYAR
jgi:hypothetical protein